MGAAESTNDEPSIKQNLSDDKIKEMNEKTQTYPSECPMHQNSSVSRPECPISSNGEAINPANMVH